MFVRQPIGDNFTWMHSGQAGAPQISGSVTSNGDMLKALDACLIDGFNEQTVESVLLEAGTATLDFGFTNHGYELRQRVTISGADDVALNGSHRVVALTPRTITINILGVTQTTGAITTKVSPLGWESIFGATDPLKRAYRSLNPETTQTVLYLDMSLPTGHGYASVPIKRAMVSMCADMQVLGEQLGSYTDAKNDYAKNPNGCLFWYQCRGSDKNSNTSSNELGPWVVVGNGDVFYFFTTITDRTNIRSRPVRDLYVFGDMPSFGGESDSFNCFWQGAYNISDATTVSTSTNGAKVTGTISTTSAGYSAYFIRDHTGLVDMELASLTPSGGRGGYNTGYTGGVIFPNPVNNSIVAVPVYVISATSLRCAAPRLLAIPQELDQSNPINFDLVIADNILTVAVHYGSGSGDLYGYFAIDMGD